MIWHILKKLNNLNKFKNKDKFNLMIIHSNKNLIHYKYDYNIFNIFIIYCKLYSLIKVKQI